MIGDQHAPMINHRDDACSTPFKFHVEFHPTPNSMPMRVPREKRQKRPKRLLSRLLIATIGIVHPSDNVVKLDTVDFYRARSVSVPCKAFDRQSCVTAEAPLQVGWRARPNAQRESACQHRSRFLNIH